MNLLKKHVLPLAGAAMMSLAIVLPQTASSEEVTVAVRMFGAGKGNPYSGCNCTPGVFAWAPVFETLTKLNPDGSPGPLLATSWENVEPTRWRFKLQTEAAVEPSGMRDVLKADLSSLVELLKELPHCPN